MPGTSFSEQFIKDARRATAREMATLKRLAESTDRWARNRSGTSYGPGVTWKVLNIGCAGRRPKARPSRSTTWGSCSMTTEQVTWRKRRTGSEWPRATGTRNNTIGLIALIAGVIGFVFACIPGALVVGWVLLPIALILGIVGVCQSGMTKGTSIGAIIIAIIGIVVGVVVFFTVVGNAFQDAFHKSGLTAPTSALNGQESAQTPPADVLMGNPARDGDLEFIVTAITHPDSVSNPDGTLQATPNGEFVVVHLTVQNVGSEQATYMGINQKLIINGKQYQYDGNSTFTANSNATSQINPGVGMDTLVVYDIPPGSHAEKIELHDSTLSPGVNVKLSD